MVSLKKENKILSVVGLSTLSVALTLISFNAFALTETLNQEFLLVLVCFFILIIAAQLYFVHTVYICQKGLVYVSNKKEKVIPWGNIGSVEVLGLDTNKRHQRLLLRNTAGNLMRGFPCRMLQVDIHEAATLIRSRLQ